MSLAALVVLMFAGLPPAPARTQAAAWDDALATSLTGTWVLSISTDAAQALVDAGIETAVSDMPPLVDRMAADRLRSRLPVSSRITLSVTEARIVATFAHATFDTVPGIPTTLPTPGDPTTTLEVVQLLRAGRLEGVFTADGGTRWTMLTPSSDGTRLSLDAIVRSDRLGADVRFRIPYRRSS